MPIKYIFCINTGRSGSHYLSQLLEHVEGCCSFHEPQPRCHGPEKKQFLLGHPAAMKVAAEQKFSAIQEAMDGYSVYAETSLLFVQGFGWFLPEHIDESEMGVVVLGRDKEKIVRSYLERGITPLTSVGQTWLLTPEKQSSRRPPPRLRLPRKVASEIKRFYRKRGSVGPDWMARYDQDYLDWYVDEMQHMGELYRERFPGITYLDLRIDDLNTIEDITEKLLEPFGLTALDSMRTVVGKPSNLKKEDKATAPNNAYVHEQQ